MTDQHEDAKAMEVAASAEGHDGHPRCGANKRGGGSCQQAAGWGTNHAGIGRCKLHGGSTPTVSRGAERQLVEAEARILFDKIAPEIVPVGDPLSAYAAFAGRVMAWLALMDSLLDNLTSPRYEAGSEQIRGEVILFERAMDRANTVLASYSRLNIDARLMKIEQEKADLLLAAIEAALSAIGVQGEDAMAAKRVMARHLRAIGGATEPREGA